MGSGKHVDPDERCVVYQEAVWNRRSLKADHKFVTGSVYPLWTSRLSGSISDLPSYGSGLERLCYRYMR